VQTDSLAAVLRAWAVPIGVAALWMLLIWSVHRESPRTLVSFHGLLHAAIVEELAGPGKMTLPPENPFFAGQPVAYYWFFHLLAAQLVSLFSLNLFHAMETVILFAAGILMIVAVSLGRKLYKSTMAGVLMGYLIMAGTNPLGIFFAIADVARNGMQALDDDPDYLWGVVHPLYSMIRYNDFGGLYGPLFNFFLNITSRPAALASLLLTALCLYLALSRKRPAHFIFFGLAFALTTALSPIIGLTTGAALGAGLVVTWLWEGRFSKRSEPLITPATIIWAGLAMVLGILLAAPTYYHLISGPSSSSAQLSLFSVRGLRHALSVTLSILPLAAIAVIGLVKAPRDRRPFLVVLFLSALALLALNVAITLPAGNQSNMFHAAAVLLAVPAAGAVLRRNTPQDTTARCSGRAALVIALIFLPTLLALLAAYVDRPPVPASFESVHIERLPRDSDLALFYEWARNETGRDAVFIVDPRERVALCGNTLELPAMTGRSILTEHSRHYLAEPYPESGARVDMATRLVSGEEPRASDVAYLSSFNRPVFIISYSSEDSLLINQMKSHYGPPVFQQGDVSVYKWPLP
jgi:hypothetical protein